MSLLEPFLLKWPQTLRHKIMEIIIKSYRSLSKIQCFMWAPPSLGSSVFIFFTIRSPPGHFLGLAWITAYTCYQKILHISGISPEPRVPCSLGPTSQLHSPYSESLSAETTHFRHNLKGLRSLNNLITPAFCVPTKWVPHGWGQGPPPAWSFWTLVAVAREYLGGRTWGNIPLWGPLQTEYPSGSFLSRKNLSRDLVISYLWPNGACGLANSLLSQGKVCGFSLMAPVSSLTTICNSFLFSCRQQKFQILLLCLLFSVFTPKLIQINQQWWYHIWIPVSLKVSTVKLISPLKKKLSFSKIN